MCTLVCVMLVTYHQPTTVFAQKNWWIFIVALVGVLVTIISLSCCEGVRRTSPTNMIFLAIFTIAESIMVAYATIPYSQEDNHIVIID